MDTELVFAAVMSKLKLRFQKHRKKLKQLTKFRCGIAKSATLPAKRRVSFYGIIVKFIRREIEDGRTEDCK